MKIILTGATGFVGKEILSKISLFNYIIVGRSKPKDIPQTKFYKSELKAFDNFSSILQNTDVVIHCAARVHVMKEASINPLESFREVNTEGTINLAKQAAKSGVKRFIFISSIKVNGESTTNEKCFTDKDIANPLDPYGLSKAEAENAIKNIAEQTGMEVVIIRPPLVYGPDVKANFAMMLKLVSFGIPLPFGCIVDNRRSMVYVENLVDLIVKCISHPNAANQTFLVSDDDDLSTARLVKELSKAMGGKGWALPIPPIIFEIVGKITGKSEFVDRLCGSLNVDITKTKELLNWTPPFTVKEGFANTVKHFLQNK
jgi:nucleoside-diphosphate-sugar epimerase